jgi:phage tail sheath protein FI
MPEYLTPGVYFEFRDAEPPVIRRLRTDITGFVGLTERGPLDKPVQIDSWRQFQAVFGTFVPYGFLAYAVKGFFENGGRTCFVVRISGSSAAKASLMLKNAAEQDFLRLDAMNEGTWGNRIAVTLTQIIRSPVPTFSLTVTRDRLEQKSFTNLSLDPNNQRYFVHILNAGDERTSPSQWVRVTDLIPAGIARTADWLPDPKQSGLKNRLGFLTGGQDGVKSLTKDDFLGETDPLARERKGLSTLDRVDAVGIVCIPDIHIQPVRLPSTLPPQEEPPKDPCLPEKLSTSVATPISPSEPEQPPKFSEAEVLDVQRAMVEHCERLKDRVAILDAPVKAGSGTSLTLSEIQTWRQQFDSERGYATLYYPWIKVVDPLRTNGSPVRAIPPCGHIAGLYARSDLTVGVHKAPANAELFWSEDLTVEINEEEQGVLNPEGINCLRAFPGRGIRVYGARTLSSNPDWRYVNVRRLLLMIEEAVDESTQWAVFETNSLALRQLIRLSVSSYLESLWRQGALVGTTPEEAFFVKCDESNNPPTVVNQGQLITDIGVRPANPAEFIIFRVGRTVEELEIVER